MSRHAPFRGAVLALAAALALTLALPGATSGHRPGTFGGKAQRLCEKPMRNRSIVVAVTRISCRKARRVVNAVFRRDGRSPRGWRCPRGVGSPAYGHCHGKGPRHPIVHWGLND